MTFKKWLLSLLQWPLEGVGLFLSPSPLLLCMKRVVSCVRVKLTSVLLSLFSVSLLKVPANEISPFFSLR